MASADGTLPVEKGVVSYLSLYVSAVLGRVWREGGLAMTMERLVMFSSRLNHGVGSFPMQKLDCGLERQTIENTLETYSRPHWRQGRQSRLG